MRVVTFLHSFEPGGVERVALRLHRAWIADGVDAHLVMGREDGAMRREAHDLSYVTLSDGRIPTAAWETLWMIAKLPRVIRQLRPDVLFCAGNSYSVVSVAMKLILGRDCPPVVAKISNDLARTDMIGPYRWAYHRWLRLQARFIDRFVGMAEPMRGEISTAMRISPARVTIIDDPALTMADVARFAAGRSEAAGHHGRRFLGVGRMARQKNFALMIAAFAQIARPEDRLTILGEGPDRAALQRLIEQRGLADQIDMPGYATDLATQFGERDVFVLSSDFEGVPAVIVEALASGIAIVATDCSVSMADMLGGGTLGALVPTGDATALATAMDAALTIPAAVAPRQAQAQRFTIERAARSYIDVFRSGARQRTAA